MAQTEPIDTSKNKIYKELRRSIIMGHRTPGDRLDVDDLAQRYETSVTPVRDALQMLNQEGLVAIKPRSGYFVNRITLKELRDMLDMRKVLELASIERSVMRITEEQISQMKKVHTGYTGDADFNYRSAPFVIPPGVNRINVMFTLPRTRFFEFALPAFSPPR